MYKYKKKTYLHMYKSVNPVKVPHSHAVKTRYCADAAVQESFCFSATTDFFLFATEKVTNFYHSQQMAKSQPDTIFVHTSPNLSVNLSLPKSSFSVKKSHR